MAVSENQQLVPLDEAIRPVRDMLFKNMKGFAAALGNYMPPERFLGAVLTQCRMNQDLLDPRKTEPLSLLLTALRIAHLRLSLDPALGQAWPIPRKGKAEMQLGYKGCIQLAYRSPLVAAVRYNVVGPNCRFVWRDGKDWVLEHEPSEEGWPDKMADVRAAWAILDLASGRSVPRVMYQAEILRHKARGSGSQPAWITDPAPMSVKTALGDLCRRGPFEGEIGRAFAIDHLGEVGKGQPPASPEESGIIDIQTTATNGEPTNVRSAAERFKAAHRETQPPTIGPETTAEGEPPPTVEEEAGVPEGGDPELIQALQDSIDERLGFLQDPVAAAIEPAEPAMISPAKVTMLADTAEKLKIDPEALKAECIRLAGTGSLSGLLAEHEGSMMLWMKNHKGRKG